MYFVDSLMNMVTHLYFNFCNKKLKYKCSGIFNCYIAPIIEMIFCDNTLQCSQSETYAFGFVGKRGPERELSFLIHEMESGKIIATFDLSKVADIKSIIAAGGDYRAIESLKYIYYLLKQNKLEAIEYFLTIDYEYVARTLNNPFVANTIRQCLIKRNYYALIEMLIKHKLFFGANIYSTLSLVCVAGIDAQLRTIRSIVQAVKEPPLRFDIEQFETYVKEQCTMKSEPVIVQPIVNPDDVFIIPKKLIICDETYALLINLLK